MIPLPASSQILNNSRSSDWVSCAIFFCIRTQNSSKSTAPLPVVKEDKKKFNFSVWLVLFLCQQIRNLVVLRSLQRHYTCSFGDGGIWTIKLSQTVKWLDSVTSSALGRRQLTIKTERDKVEQEKAGKHKGGGGCGSLSHSSAFRHPITPLHLPCNVRELKTVNLPLL